MSVQEEPHDVSASALVLACSICGNDELSTASAEHFKVPDGWESNAWRGIVGRIEILTAFERMCRTCDTTRVFFEKHLLEDAVSKDDSSYPAVTFVVPVEEIKSFLTNLSSILKKNEGEIEKPASHMIIPNARGFSSNNLHTRQTTE
jgi:hypothetical protein